MHKRLFVLLILALFLVGGAMLYANLGSVWVQAKTTKLRQDPSKDNKGDIDLARGTELKAELLKKNWYKVKVASTGKTGWVYQGKVAKSAVKEDPSLTKEGKTNPKIGEELAAGSSVRGLGPMSQKFANSQRIQEIHQRFTDYHQSYICTNKTDFAPKLNRGILPVKITDKDLEVFLQEGRLGEFRHEDIR